MNAALDNFSACVDVFAMIWSVWREGKEKKPSPLKIGGTKLEANLQQNDALYNDIYGRILANMSRSDLVQASIGSCHKQ